MTGNRRNKHPDAEIRHFCASRSKKRTWLLYRIPARSRFWILAEAASKNALAQESLGH
jgi:hypothetical protein